MAWPHALSVSWDGTLRVWHLATSSCLRWPGLPLPAQGGAAQAAPGAAGPLPEVGGHRGRGLHPLLLLLGRLRPARPGTGAHRPASGVPFLASSVRQVTLVQEIGVGSEAMREVGVRALNTYSGQVVAVAVEEAGVVSHSSSNQPTGHSWPRPIILWLWWNMSSLHLPPDHPPQHRQEHRLPGGPPPPPGAPTSLESGSTADLQDFWHTAERDFFHEEQFMRI